MSLPAIELKVRVRGRHPLFYRKMIHRPARPLPAGGPVVVRDRDGKLVGTGFYNPRSELALRLFTATAVDDVDAHLLLALQNAVALREDVLQLQAVSNAYRLVHAEGDGLPALVLDRLGDAFVAQVGCLGMQQRMEPFGEWLLQRYPGARLVLQQDEDAAAREGMERLPRPPAFTTNVQEHGIGFTVAPGSGHKTGFFADQRDNRLLVRTLARGRRVLDLCCNSGGFALNAARGGARSVRAADLDEAMVEQTMHNAAQNRLPVDVVHGDAFDLLRELRPGSHDLIVLDPPKWIHSRQEIDTGIVRYQDLNRLAFDKLDRGGILVTCSCSGSLSEEAFLWALREAASHAGRDARVLFVRGAGPDHPVALETPETRYLKVVVLQVR